MKRQRGPRFRYDDANRRMMILTKGYPDGYDCREYSRRFPNRIVPDSRAFPRVFTKLRETDAVPSSHISSERVNEQNVDEVEDIIQLVERSPATSTRRISARIGVPHTRVWRTLRMHGFYPHHLQRIQHLRAGDEGRRLQFCRWLLVNRRVIPFLLFTDEATFTRDGINNTRNSHQWSEENPHAIVEIHFQERFSVNVWCGMIDNQLLGPVVLPHRPTGPCYLGFLQNQLPALLEEVPLATRMGEVYKEKVNTGAYLIVRIMNNPALIEERQEDIRRAARGVVKRSRKCIEVGGGIYEKQF
ncbi:hypothetical protein ANN_27160 [Periplaneta americana]|uniref:Transposase n=1 Tax=Periplaneta americana TaxID=6978 RepID=A0ABQ8RXE1_PERAM|nr:hypothetical protein ANN_27160 [Periplaneta americana]